MSSILSPTGFLKKTLFFSLFVVLLFFARTSFAAELNLSPTSGSYNVGDTIQVRVVLSSLAQPANAVSGTLSFSKDLLTLNSISKANSLISLWPIEPSYSNVSGTANMEGVILNGYAGSNGTIATLSFRAKAVGKANIKFTTSSVLAHDGQGTNILLSTGQANFDIAKAADKPVAPAVESKKETPSLVIQEIKKKNELDSFARFLLTSVGKKDKSLYKVEIDDTASPWENQESGIFETPRLPKGTHTIKVQMDTVNNDIITSSASFSVSSILIPIFTDYSKEIKENEYIVVKGVAGPNIDVVINSNRILPGGKAVNEAVIIKSNDKGLFTYVSENRAVGGVYMITANARTSSGSESEKSLPIKISVSTKTISISTGIMNTLSFLIPIFALLTLLIILIIWGWYKILHYQENMHKKLMRTRALVSKSFDILDEDVVEEIKIFKKIKARQPLTNDERLFVNQFQKDIKTAEQVIENEIKESEK